MLHVEDVLVPDGEDDEDREDGAADEGDVPGEDGGQGGDEDVHVVGGGLVGSRQTDHQLVVKLIEMSEYKNLSYLMWEYHPLPEIISSKQAPLSDAQTAGLTFDNLCIVVETVQDLPE